MPVNPKQSSVAMPPQPEHSQYVMLLYQAGVMSDLAGT